MRNTIVCILFLLNFACSKVSNPPIAILQSYPPKGDSSTLFEINAEASYDDVSLKPTLEFRWDFNGDGIWDTGFEPNAITTRYFKNPSTYVLIVQVRDQDGLMSQAIDSIIVFGQNKDISSFTDSRDGQTYRTIKIDDKWWMAECLRYGKAIDPWTQPQLDNQIIEHYLLWSSLNKKEYCTYSWHEAMNYKLNNHQGICPDGWHIPTKTEWKSLYKEMPKFYAAKYFGKKGLSGLNLDDGKRITIERKDQIIDESINEAAYWCSDNFFTDKGILIVSFGSFTPINIDLSLIEETNLHYYNDIQLVNTVRCIKD